MRHKRRIAALGIASILALFAAVAGVAAVLSQQTITDTGNLHLRVVRSDANGLDSGWHVHPGIAIVQVQEGAFQIYQGTCAPLTVGAGQTYIEVPHMPVRAIATGRVKWTTTLITSGDGPSQIPLADYMNNKNYNPCPSVP